VELHAAIQKRTRLGDIDEPNAKQVIARFEHHLKTRFVRQMVNDSVLDVATDLVNRYPLRAYDAIQLAGCMKLQTASAGAKPIFVCADRQLLHAAESEKLEVVNVARQ
jgi:uncharacterized protein